MLNRDGTGEKGRSSRSTLPRHSGNPPPRSGVARVTNPVFPLRGGCALRSLSPLSSSGRSSFSSPPPGRSCGGIHSLSSSPVSRTPEIPVIHCPNRPKRCVLFVFSALAPGMLHFPNIASPLPTCAKNECRICQRKIGHVPSLLPPIEKQGVWGNMRRKIRHVDTLNIHDLWHAD